MANPFAGQQLPPPTETRGPMLLKSSWIQLAIATPFVLGRMYARIKQIGKLRLDDYLMIMSWVFGIITNGLVTEAVRWGFGRHIYYLTEEEATQSIRWSFIVAPFAYFFLVFGRVSFAVSLIILIGTNKWRRWFLYLLILGQFVVNLVMAGVGIGNCNPVHKAWDRDTPGTCLDPRIRRYTGYTQGVFNIFTDLVLAILPAVVISQLNLKRKLKVGLISLMGLGIFNMVAAIVTLVQHIKVTKTVDKTYAYVIIDMWGLIQGNLVLIIASIAFLRPLFTGRKAFSMAYYRSLVAKYSYRSRSSGQNHSDSMGTEDIVYEGDEKGSHNLPPFSRDRFVTSTTQKAGKEAGFDRLSSMETGKAPSK